MMDSPTLSSYFYRTPFIPFEFLLRGGHVARLMTPENLTVGRHFLQFKVLQADESEVFFFAKDIIALRSLQYTGDD